jgi:hypothetical protein
MSWDRFSSLVRKRFWNPTRKELRAARTRSTVGYFRGTHGNRFERWICPCSRILMGRHNGWPGHSERLIKTTAGNRVSTSLVPSPCNTGRSLPLFKKSQKLGLGLLVARISRFLGRIHSGQLTTTSHKLPGGAIRLFLVLWHLRLLGQRDCRCSPPGGFVNGSGWSPRRVPPAPLYHEN